MIADLVDLVIDNLFRPMLGRVDLGSHVFGDLWHPERVMQLCHPRPS